MARQPKVRRYDLSPRVVHVIVNSWGWLLGNGASGVRMPWYELRPGQVDNGDPATLIPGYLPDDVVCVSKQDLFNEIYERWPDSSGRRSAAAATELIGALTGEDD